MTDTLEPRTHVRPLPSAAATRAFDSWREALAEILGDRPLSVLDAGSGDGSSTLLLGDLGHHPHGVDRAPDQVAVARARAGRRCAAAAFRVGDAEDLDFPAGSFDAVHARDLLSALAHPQWALAEWFRVLRPGGRLVVAELALPGRRDVVAAQLRNAGFGDVGSREMLLVGDDSPRAPRPRPWYRCFAPVIRRRWCVAWGTRR